MAALGEVEEPAGGGHEDVAAPGQLAALELGGRAAVQQRGPHVRAGGELARLITDLGRIG